MAREYIIQDLISLPRLNGSAAVALAEQLSTIADAEQGAGLPLLVERPLGRLRSAILALKEELEPELEDNSGAKVAADRNEDRAWRSLSDWVGSLAGMPDGSFPELDQVRSLHSLAFSEGLSFLVLPYIEEWTQSETRLNLIAEEGYEPLIVKLGGTPLLDNLKAAHKHYGEVLGITSPVTAQESSALQKRLRQLISDMKEYVFKVIALAETDEPGSEALSAALLLPLTAWKETTGSRPKPEEPSTPAEPAASE